MAIGDIGIWQDNVGGLLPGTAYAGVAFPSEFRNDNSNITKGTASTYVLKVGYYLFVGNIVIEDTSNGRLSTRVKLQLNSGTADIWTSYYTGYNRDNSENESYIRVLAFVNVKVDGATLEVRWRRDSDAATGGTILGQSFIQIAQIDTSAFSIYRDNDDTGNSYGGTTPNDVLFEDTVIESTSSISIGLDKKTISLLNTSKRYLVLYCLSFENSSSSRTQRIGQLIVDGVVAKDSRSYAYMRTSASGLGGLGGAYIIEAKPGAKTFKVQVYRGDGVSADQGGALHDGTTLTQPFESGICIIELPDYVEVYKAHDHEGLQNVTPTTRTILNLSNTVDIIDTAAFSKKSSTTFLALKAMDAFIWANIWTARYNVASESRFTGIANVTIQGLYKAIGEHGNYTRGNQSSTDSFGGSFHPGGIYALEETDNIYIDIVRIVGGEAGGTDRTQPDTAGVLAININSFVVSTGEVKNVTAAIDLTTLTNSPKINSQVDLSAIISLTTLTSSPIISLHVDLSALINLTTLTNLPLFSRIYWLTANHFPLTTLTNSPTLSVQGFDNLEAIISLTTLTKGSFLTRLIEFDCTINLTTITEQTDIYREIELSSLINLSTLTNDPQINLITPGQLSATISLTTLTNSVDMYRNTPFSLHIFLTTLTNTSFLYTSAQLSASINLTTLTNEPTLSVAGFDEFSAIISLTTLTSFVEMFRIVPLTTLIQLTTLTNNPSLNVEGVDNLEAAINLTTLTSFIKLNRLVPLTTEINLTTLTNSPTLSVAGIDEFSAIINLTTLTEFTKITRLMQLTTIINLTTLTNNPSFSTGVGYESNIALTTLTSDPLLNRLIAFFSQVLLTTLTNEPIITAYSTDEFSGVVNLTTLTSDDTEIDKFQKYNRMIILHDGSLVLDYTILI